MMELQIYKSIINQNKREIEREIKNLKDSPTDQPRLNGAAIKYEYFYFYRIHNFAVC